MSFLQVAQPHVVIPTTLDCHLYIATFFVSLEVIVLFNKGMLHSILFLLLHGITLDH